MCHALSVKMKHSSNRRTFICNVAYILHTFAEPVKPNSYRSSSHNMTPFKHFSSHPDWSKRIRRGGIYLAVAAIIGGHTACSNDNGNDWETVTTYEATKGVITTLEETEAGQFTVADEQIVPSKAESRIIVRHLDGKVDTLTMAQAKNLVQPADTVVRTEYRHHSHGLGHVLWWSSMGYMMGRNFSSPVNSNIYRPVTDEEMRRRGYAGGSAYRAGSFAADELRRSSVPRTEVRPVRARSGFFRGFRGSSGG